MMPTSQSTVRTDADGRFLIAELPAGSQMLEVRHVGATPITQTVALLPRTTTDVSLNLSRVTELATVNIREEQFLARDRLDFEYRKKAGFGYRLEESDFKHAFTIASVLQIMPGMNVTTRRDGTLNMSPIRSSVTSRTNVTVWIDGVPSSVEELSSIDPRNLRAVEWYPRVTTAPAKYVGIQGSPVLLVWTHQARWASPRPNR